jgi:hypothetical protein
MNNSVFITKKKPDLSFIASLIIIIIFALYLGVDSFKKSNLSDYLEKTSNELLAKIVNQDDRSSLKQSYTELIEKIENKEIAAEKAEQLAANLINLKLAKEYLNQEELRVVLQTTFNEAAFNDSLKIIIESVENERWLVLNEKVNNIERFEENLAKTQLHDRPLNISGEFEYAIDESLHIIADDSFKEDLIISQNEESVDRIFVLEHENHLKWSKDLKKHLSREREEIKKNIALQKRKTKLNISSSISSKISQIFSISSFDSGGVIELKFNYGPHPGNIDTLIYTIPEIPEIPDIQVD